MINDMQSAKPASLMLNIDRMNAGREGILFVLIS